MNVQQIEQEGTTPAVQLTPQKRRQSSSLSPAIFTPERVSQLGRTDAGTLNSVRSRSLLWQIQKF